MSPRAATGRRVRVRVDIAAAASIGRWRGRRYRAPRATGRRGRRYCRRAHRPPRPHRLDIGGRTHGSRDHLARRFSAIPGRPALTFCDFASAGRRFY